MEATCGDFEPFGVYLFERTGLMFRLIFGVASILALAWWKRNMIQAFYDDWYSREVEIIVQTKSSSPQDQTDSEPAEEMGQTEEAEPAEDVTVYVTASGTRYHQAGCRSVTESAEAISLSEVVDRYQPCGRCKPPV
jgi:hypothetical protein